MAPMKILSSLSLFLIAAQAATIRFYPFVGCSGTAVQCGNINAGVCCSASNVYASAKLLDTFDCTFDAWASLGCTGFKQGGALVGVLISGKYFTINHDNDRRDISTHDEECVKPDSIVYTNIDGDEVVVPIPEGQQALYEAAVLEGDLSNLGIQNV
ncbi:hypothetical protein BDQ12DRAFT_663416 [Crucibulum laeve]|uniref:Hydrophobin n=1 Tax=Crucibulum laeve TaxID=68775 RepID=A0A5C3ME89_9AGAR|nr:hypothetical protein BDQ12DRAFT_663416 [Crucibulum laeve]